MSARRIKAGSQPAGAAPAEDSAKILDPSFIMLQEEKDLVRWMSKDIAVLDYFAGVPERVPRELWIALETLRKNKGEELYMELLYALTHKYFPSQDAQLLWDAIVQHKRELAAKIGRDVSMKVAVLDYLDNQAEHSKDLQLLPEEDLDHLLLSANEDGLTSLYNHRYFQERLRYEVTRCGRYQHALSLLLIDVDHFKSYNDSYGHLKGDVLLRGVSHFFKTSCRQADTVARYGGDEFAFILPETDPQQALSLAARLQRDFNAKQFGNLLPGLASAITISIGLAAFQQDYGQAEDLIAAADHALYRAKQNGRNCIFYEKQKGVNRRPQASRR